MAVAICSRAVIRHENPCGSANSGPVPDESLYLAFPVPQIVDTYLALILCWQDVGGVGEVD